MGRTNARSVHPAALMRFPTGSVGSLATDESWVRSHSSGCGAALLELRLFLPARNGRTGSASVAHRLLNNALVIPKGQFDGPRQEDVHGARAKSTRGSAQASPG
jgi:hypothetical protein